MTSRYSETLAAMAERYGAPVTVGNLTQKFLFSTKMKVGDRNTPLALCAAYMNGRFQRGHGHVHIGRIGCDAVFAGPENGQPAIHAIDRSTARAGLALVTRHRRVPEVHAARPLQQIAGSRGHVSNLHSRAAQDCFGKNSVVLPHQRVPGQVGVANDRTDR